MEPIQITRCATWGWIPEAGVIRHDGRYLWVLSRTYVNGLGSRSMTCPSCGCSRTYHAVARVATVEEITEYLREEAERTARKEWSDALIAERRAAYLARRKVQ